MRKLLSISITIMIAALLVVACSPEGNKVENKTAIVSFSTGDNTTRSLTRVNPEFKASDYYWSYTATKTDSTGLNTGATATAEKVKESDKGLAAVGPFSYGVWSFTLYGYVDSGREQLAYSGTSTATISDSSTTIAVTVTVQNSDNGKGYLEIPAKGTIKITGTSVNVSDWNKFVEKMTIKSLDTANNSTDKTFYDKAASEGNTDGVRKIELSSGNYAVTIAYLEGATRTDETTCSGGYTVASDTIYVTILDYLTTKIGGDVAENTGNVTFDVADGTVRAISEVTNLKSDQATAISVAASPSTTNSAEGGSAEGVRKTTVSIPNGIVSEATSAKVSVTSYTQEAASKEKATFEIENKGTTDSNTAQVLGGLDIDLYLNNSEEKTTKFDENKVLTITTVIVKGLYTGANNNDYNDIVVKYNGEGLDNGTVISYNSSTGELTFTVNHLSSFYIGSKSAIVYNSTTQTAYTTLSEAISKANAGDTLVLLKDIDLGTTKNAIGVEKSITLDLNGYSVTSEARVFEVHSGILTIDNGTIKADITNDSGKSVIKVDSSKGNAGLVLKNSAKIEAPSSYGITAFGSTSNTSTLDIYGTIESTNPCLAGNGHSNYKNNKVIMNVYAGAVLTKNPSAEKNWKENDDKVAIYQPNNGVLNIYGGTITCNDGSAVEIREGNATISGGTLKTGISSADNYKVTANGSGPTVVGAALAIDYYGTGVDTAKNGIIVNIEGGTFEGAKQLALVNSANRSVDDTKLVKAVVKSSISLTSDKVVGFTADKTGDKTYYVDREAACENGVGGDVRIGTTLYPTIQKAFEYIKDNSVKDVTIEILSEKVALESNLKTLLGAADTKEYTITFKGKGSAYSSIDIRSNTTAGESSKANYVEGAKLNFDDITVIIGNASNYQGFIRSGDLTFTNCSLVGMGSYWGNGKAYFKNCVFEDINANKEATDSTFDSSYYNMWLYQGDEFEFDGCTFNSLNGRFINAYQPYSENKTIKVTITGCKFDGGTKGTRQKAAIVLKPETVWDVNLNTITVSEKVATGTTSGSQWYEIDDGKYTQDTKVSINNSVVWQNGAKV